MKKKCIFKHVVKYFATVITKEDNYFLWSTGHVAFLSRVFKIHCIEFWQRTKLHTHKHTCIHTCIHVQTQTLTYNHSHVYIICTNVHTHHTHNKEKLIHRLTAERIIGQLYARENMSDFLKILMKHTTTTNHTHFRKHQGI